MKIKKILTWLGIFLILLAIVNVSIGMIISPAGIVREVELSDLIISLSYFVFLFIIFKISKILKSKEILTAAFIYSIIPLFSIVGMIFVRTPFFILTILLFYWIVPFAGISFGNTLVAIILVFIQPIIIWILIKKL